MKNENVLESIAEGSALISEFMGLEKSQHIWNNGEFAYTMKYPDVFNKYVIPSDMKYHVYWDWLMPVWIKFRDLEYQERMLNHSHWRFIISNQLYFAKDPSELFPLLVSAIKWYFET